jgi:hypothetical protein
VLAPALVLVLGLAAAGCTDQPEEANDNPPEPEPVVSQFESRTPVPDPSAGLTVPLPGETNSPDVSADVTPTP